MGMHKGEQIEKWIDLSQLPRSKSGNLIRWPMTIGHTVNFIYGDNLGHLTIVDKLSKDKYKVLISTKDENFEYILSSDCIRCCKLGGAFARPIAVTHPELIKYFVNKDDAYKYQAHSDKIAKMQCPLCGTAIDKTIRVLTDLGLACPSCSDGVSYPNKFMYNIFKQLQIDFKNEVTKATNGFEWIAGNYRYDFYFELNKSKYFVEMDGKFHDGSCFLSYENAYSSDQTKDNIANQHGVTMIRIDCKYSKVQNRYEHIKNNILNSELGLVLNLQHVDWNAANSFAVDSNIRISAELWNNTDCCAIDIGNQLGVSRDTARGYLKIASGLGLCNYNDKEIADRMTRRIVANNKNKSKPIALYKDGNIVNVFLGVVDLDRQSESLYGVHMDYRNTHAVCSGRKKQAYGYTMSFITSDEYDQFASQLNQIVQN